MTKIKMNCDCGKVHEVHRDKDAPENAISMGCNWCPDCEDTSDDYYNEWYNTNDDGSNDLEPDVPDNQLMLFSVADNILQNHTVTKNNLTPKEKEKIIKTIPLPNKIIEAALISALQSQNSTVVLKFVSVEEAAEAFKKLSSDLIKSSLAFDDLSDILQKLKKPNYEETRSVIPPKYNKRKFR